MSGVGHYARGTKAWAICQRCGLRGLLHDMVSDEYFPGMVVHPACLDHKHQQEKLPHNIDDPMALFKPSPESSNTLAAVLSGNNSGSSNLLNWTEASFGIGRVERYAVYRSTDGGTVYVTLTSIAVTYTDFGEISAETLTYTDTPVSAGSYLYYVSAFDIYDRELRSNILPITV